MDHKSLETGEFHEDENSGISEEEDASEPSVANVKSKESSGIRTNSEEVKADSSTSRAENGDPSSENKQGSCTDTFEVSRIDRELDEDILDTDNAEKEQGNAEKTTKSLSAPTCWDDSAETLGASSSAEAEPSGQNISTFTDSAMLLKDSGIIYFDLPEVAEQSTATLQMSQLMSTVLSDICSDDDSGSEDLDSKLSRKEIRDISISGPPNHLDIPGPSGNSFQQNCRSASTGDLPQETNDPSVFSISGVHINQLPDEVLHYIFSLFTIGELCRLVAQVCRRWCSLVCDPIHWQELVVGHLSTEQLDHCLRRATLLKKLDLGGRDELTIDETLLFSNHCPQLQELDLAFCDTLTNTQLKIISEKCRNLQQVNLEGCLHVDDESLTFLSRLPKLIRVNLSHCSMVQTEGVISLATNLKRITELNIDGIPSVTDSAIFTLVKHHAAHMEKLSVDGAELTDEAVEAFTHFNVLTELKFSFAELLTDVALIHLKKMKRLRSLKMKKGSDFSTECLLDLFTLDSLPSLRFLDLSECVHLLDNGIQAMVKCCGKTLRHLTLCWCWNITDIGLESIVGGCPELVTLQLVGLDKIKGHCLVQLPTAMPKLTLLDLQQCNRVIDDLVVDVVRALPQLVAYNYYGERFQSASKGDVLMIK